MGHLTKADAADPDLHIKLMKMRNQAYAHTDRASGRAADLRDLTRGGKRGIAFGESWWPLPVEWLPSIIRGAEEQRDRFRAEALALSSGLADAAE